MRDLALLAMLFAWCYIGLALIAISQSAHWLRLTGQRHCPSRPTSLLRAGGAAFLIASLVVAFWRDQADFASMIWLLTFSVSASAVACTLAWRPQSLRWLSRVAVAFIE
jgi:hypothetical protein